MGTIVQVKSPIRNRFIERFYVCPKCKNLFQARRVASASIICPYCRTCRYIFRVKWKLKPKYRSLEEIKKLKKAFYIGQEGVLPVGVLKLLAEAIEDYEREKGES